MKTAIKSTFAFGLILFALTGCQTQPVSWGEAETAYASQRNRSVATAIPNQQAWYAERNDAQTTVYSGYRGATTETSVTYSRDRQAFHHGHVHNSLNDSTTRRRTTYTIR